MIVAGIDEVGRGCLAGPVVACACVMPDGYSDERIADSKKLTEKKRETLARIIENDALSIGVGIVCSAMIDKVNILRATKQAMQRALSRIDVSYDKVIVDAVRLNNVSTPLEHPFKGEDAHLNVATASIYAKVYRDRLMKRMHIFYPEYGWYGNKGYGAQVHIEAIKKFGLTPLHRKSFCTKI